MCVHVFDGAGDIRPNETWFQKRKEIDLPHGFVSVLHRTQYSNQL